MQQEFQEFADEKAAEENRAAESVTDANSTDENRAVFLISKIPAGARIVARTYAEIDEKTGRAQYKDYVGHVVGHETAKKETGKVAKAFLSMLYICVLIKTLLSRVLFL